MELEQLRVFLAVAEHESFSAAARALFVSHSTTSRAVAALERELGAALLLREGRTVRLTREGEILSEDARRVLALVEEMKEKVKTVRSEE